MTQMGALGFGKKQETQIEQTHDPVQQAQDTVNQINEQQEKAMEVLEGFE